MPDNNPLEGRVPASHHDDEIHRRLDEISATLKALKLAIAGDITTNTPGMLERQRRMEERLERHSERLRELEAKSHDLVLEQLDVTKQTLEKLQESRQWTVRAVLERVIGVGVAAVIGWAAGKTPPPTP